MTGEIIANAKIKSHILESKLTKDNIMKCENIKIYLHLPVTICARWKHFFRGTIANFCKNKMCIISNVDYCPGSKK